MSPANLTRTSSNWNPAKLATPDHFSPEGTNENSPQFQLRDKTGNGQSPGGAAETGGFISVVPAGLAGFNSSSRR
jgi:hypothetical protein